MDLGQVFTSPIVARYMVSLLNVSKSSSILDPCFGNGAFINACLDEGYTNITGYEIDNHLYNSVKQVQPRLKLYNSDYLQADEAKKFDAILMNPPYIRHEKIDELSYIGISKKTLRLNPIFLELPTTANMYMYFIIKALQMLNIDGNLVVIFPSSWLNARSGKSFEQLISKQATIEKQIHISGEVFQKSALVDVVILCIKKTIEKSDREIIHLNLSDDVITPRIIQRSTKKLIATPVPFHIYANVRRGLTTGANDIFINPPLKHNNEYLISIVSSPKSIIGFSTTAAITDHLLWLHGEKKKFPKSVQEYLSQCKKMIISTQKPKTLYLKIQQHYSWYELSDIDSDGILFSYFVRNDMKFIMNTTNVLARDNFYIIKPQIDRHLLFALLNNYYTFYQLERMGKKYGAGLLKLQRYDIEKILFPDIASISSSDKEHLINLSKHMIDNNEDMIAQITLIISRYMNCNYKEICEDYALIKQQRLEDK
ncbi:N-6 DNA methylase [Ruminococcus sp. NK3A76]|uniref:Eco57I restriction-modification methylase domain-containing protein n=1 Tax=Ruminococcus sp. NK3A76 TaxID=877411 RepID=UPI00048FFE55|nr:N-6 DNA methylase [Ruminococcus sp. NK3A76]